ncbi:hypothetical protein SDC9_203726 [bioreactor metagenome]|uniref:Uncharacterized protein n=1 Tax=bioreactor metagenome TaxID=1076179 RepID=A0A645IYR9_9ZZZZ
MVGASQAVASDHQSVIICPLESELWVIVGNTHDQYSSVPHVPCFFYAVQYEGFPYSFLLVFRQNGDGTECNCVCLGTIRAFEFTPGVEYVSDDFAIILCNKT